MWSLAMIITMAAFVLNAGASAQEKTTVNAKLPETREEYTLQDIRVGETVWTTPWAMWAEADGTLWLNGKYTAHSSSGGTVSLQVLRVTDGYYVDVSHCADYRWSKGEASYVGGANPLPVVKLIQ